MMDMSYNDLVVLPELIGEMYVATAIIYEDSVPGFQTLLADTAKNIMLLRSKIDSPSSEFDAQSEKDGDGGHVDFPVTLEKDDHRSLQSVHLRLAGQIEMITEPGDPWLTILQAIKGAVGCELSRRGGWVDLDGGRGGITEGVFGEEQN